MWSDTLKGGRTGLGRALAGPVSPPVVLVGAADHALFLSSRAALPSYVEVLAAARNPYLGGCPTVTVELWTVALRSTGQAARRLDAKTFQLRDPWFDSWEELILSFGGYLDCRTTTTLSPGSYAGPVVFVLRAADGTELGRSVPTDLVALPSGAAADEQPTVLGPILDAGAGAIRETWSLAKVATVAAIAVGGLILAPEIRRAVGSSNG